jgi:hypothetical protein
MGPPSYMRSVVDRNVIIRHIPLKDKNQPDLYLKLQFVPRSKHILSRLYQSANSILLNNLRSVLRSVQNTQTRFIGRTQNFLV